MKQQLLQSIIATIVITFISLSCYAQGSSAPIQNGTTVYNGNLYHMQRIGVNTSSPIAKIHIDYGKYDEATTPRIGIPFLIDGLYKTMPPAGQASMYLPRTYFKVDENGFIGIGTDNPDKLLHVKGGISRFESEYGYADFGALDNQCFHFQTDMSGFNFNKSIKINGGRLIIENANGQGTGLTQIALNEDGTIRAREVKVDLQTIPDYVFENDYNLMNLDELRIYIKQYQHLPNIKNEKEFKEEGNYALGEMNVKLLEKIEELTLYILQLEERISQLENK